MPENHKSPITDQMIRAAVHRELDSVEIPPLESAWQRLQARQAAGETPAITPHRRPSWTRYSALAAALLLFFFGSYGVYRNLHTRDDLLAGMPESEGADVLTTDRDDKAGSFRAAGWEPAEFSPEVSKPPGLLDGYVLQELFTRQADSGIHYLAALYIREDASLLWVQSGAGSMDQFMADLAQLLQVLPGPLTPEGSRFSLNLNDGSALLWEKEGLYYLLWDMAGGGGETELNRLVPEK
jgi:hypothetical protein